MPGRNTGQEKVFAFSIVYLTGCTPKQGVYGLFAFRCSDCAVYCRLFQILVHETAKIESRKVVLRSLRTAY